MEEEAAKLSALSLQEAKGVETEGAAAEPADGAAGSGGSDSDDCDWADPALLAATAPAAPANASARLAAASTYAAARSIPVSNKELPPGLTHTSAPRSHGQDAAAAAAASSANTSSLQARSSVSGTPTGRHSSREVVGGGGTNRTADEDPARETPLREIAFEGAHVLE
eukprot:CAMPEP_0206151888 /NCGR_PEP_ID=MMETSP1473-20131121/39050_1 /ASSEMBLY_ACC=CAM_ASM_001109 /TAXON_ID=1461547 /ORGANISM="Stichococcus sp, Strain RCC1054" /LENGTH=167 /DNA_ID=CAMNT_0053549439 /DNA_START=247 /DNA_END=747 /DNA_ORIENTATION=-